MLTWKLCRPFNTLAGGVKGVALMFPSAGDAGGDSIIEVGTLSSDEPCRKSLGFVLFKVCIAKPGRNAPAARASTNPRPTKSHMV